MSDTLNKAYAMVRDFHVTFGIPAPDRPEMQGAYLVQRRAAFINSEVDELRDASTLAEQADAYLDVIYFAVGGLVELGIEPSRLFDIVQAANMAKLWPDGKPRMRDGDKKIIKPDGWVAPDALIAVEIERQLGGHNVG